MWNVEELIHKLESLGWRWYSDVLRPHAKSFFKTFDTPTRCNCNSEKAGMQVCCRVWPPHEDGKVPPIELELCGELSDGTWVKIEQWALPDDIDANLKRILRMLSTWEHIANHKD